MQYIRDMKELNENNIHNQLHTVRAHKHEKYIAECDAKRLAEDRNKTNNTLNSVSDADDNVKNNNIKGKKMKWDKGTYLITGDSLIIGLQEKKMGNNVKVRGFSGATISDFYTYLVPLLEKKPSNIIIMAGTMFPSTKTQMREYPSSYC